MAASQHKLTIGLPAGERPRARGAQLAPPPLRWHRPGPATAWDGHFMPESPGYGELGPFRPQSGQEW